MLAVVLHVLACVRFENLPDMPPGTASDPAIYASPKDTFMKRVAAGRLLARTSNTSWTLVGTAGEQFATSRELRERFGGVIFVGDSQIREVAWAALQMLTPDQKLIFSQRDRVFGGGKRQVLSRSACVPQSVGKTGFTATCGRLAVDGGGGTDASAAAEPCELWSPFANKSHAEAMRRMLLTRPHSWDGLLSVSKEVYAASTDFFVSYQATWGAMPIEPTSVPRCLHPAAGSNAYGLPHQRLRTTKPVLWVVDGCGLHEMEFCDARRDDLPAHVLPRFPPALLRSGTVVYQTVGAGFLMKASNRFKGHPRPRLHTHPHPHPHPHPGLNREPNPHALRRCRAASKASIPPPTNERSAHAHSPNARARRRVRGGQCGRHRWQGAPLA